MMIRLLFLLIVMVVVQVSKKSIYVEGFKCGKNHRHIHDQRTLNGHIIVPTRMSTTNRKTKMIRMMGIEASDVVSSMYDITRNYHVTTLLVADETVGGSLLVPLVAVLDPFLNFMSFAMLARVVLSWYPDATTKAMSWTAAVTIPTEPLLRAVKGVIPPAFGVDITPVFWLAIFTFIHEILLGQQGLLIMKMKYGI